MTQLPFNAFPPFIVSESCLKLQFPPKDELEEKDSGSQINQEKHQELLEAPVFPGEMRKSWRVFYSSWTTMIARGMLCVLTHLPQLGSWFSVRSLHRRLGSTCRKERGKFMIPISECLHFRLLSASLYTLYTIQHSGERETTLVTGRFLPCVSVEAKVKALAIFDWEIDF